MLSLCYFEVPRGIGINAQRHRGALHLTAARMLGNATKLVQQVRTCIWFKKLCNHLDALMFVRS